MDPTLSFGAIGALFASAAFFTGILVSGITFAWPLRPSWLPWLASMLVGPLITLGLAKANGIAFAEQVYYQCFFVGVMAGASAGGYNQMNRKGEEIRSEQQQKLYGMIETPAETPPADPPPPPPADYRPMEVRREHATEPFDPDPDRQPAIPYLNGIHPVNHGIEVTYQGEERRHFDPSDYAGPERRSGSRAPGLRDGTTRSPGPDQEWTQ
jgi:hypothetical protein